MLTIYSTPWCGYCRRLKRQLDRAGVAYHNVDIEHDSDAQAYVISVNGGNASVPTVLFSDGTTITNPSIRDVVDKLASSA